MTKTTAGYSGTPLAKKLGIIEGSIVVALHAPSDYLALLAPLPALVRFEKNVTAQTHVVHLFCDQKSKLQTALNELRHTISPDRMVWVSWPKKASKVPTDITEDTIREVALPLGFVDIKVCAVNEIWSGLKLVVRKELR
jgi:hypothetical protein